MRTRTRAGSSITRPISASPSVPGRRCCAHRASITDRKSTRLNSSHANISYAVFCLKKKERFVINPVLESRFVFLDERFSLTGLLPAISLPNREGIKNIPHFPREWTDVNFDQQTFMGQPIIIDKSLLNQVLTVCNYLSMAIKKEPAVYTIQSFLFETNRRPQNLTLCPPTPLSV